MIVSVDELKTHLRIQHGEEDSLLESLIAQAQAVAENICREAFENDAPEPVRLADLLIPGVDAMMEHRAFRDLVFSSKGSSFKVAIMRIRSSSSGLRCMVLRSST